MSDFHGLEFVALKPSVRPKQRSNIPKRGPVIPLEDVLFHDPRNTAVEPHGAGFDASGGLMGPV